MEPKWTLTQAHCNPDPKLRAAINNCDMKKLKLMFSNGSARPTDLVPPHHRSLLHETVIAHLKRRRGTLQLFDFLIKSGTDLNSRSWMDESSAILLLTYFLHNESMEKHVLDLALRLISAGADLSMLDANGDSACSLIFKAERGPSFLENQFAQHTDLITYQELADSDAWIVAAVARSSPHVDNRVRRNFKELRKPPALSSAPTRKNPEFLELSPALQVAHIQQSETRCRNRFIQSLCRRGTVTMLEPLVLAGLDINEDSGFRVSYLGEAVKYLNIDVIQLLLKYGARTAGLYSPLDILAMRWANYGPLENPRFDVEFKIFEQFIERMDEVNCCPNLLTHLIALNLEIFDRYIGLLLERGHGRKKENKYPLEPDDHGRWQSYATLGSETMQAVTVNNMSALQILIRHRQPLDIEDLGGFTPLMQAINLGNLRAVEILVGGGAICGSHASCGMSALMLSDLLVKSSHPRRPRAVGALTGGLHGTPVPWHDPGLIPLETDQQILEYLKRNVFTIENLPWPKPFDESAESSHYYAFFNSHRYEAFIVPTEQTHGWLEIKERRTPQYNSADGSYILRSNCVSNGLNSCHDRYSVCQAFFDTHFSRPKAPEDMGV